MKLKSIILGAAVTVGLVFSAQAQYHSEPLLATNQLFVAPTNFVPANYAISASPNTVISGGGLFEVKPEGQDAFFAAQPGVTYSLIYSQTAYNTVTNVPGTPVATNLVATFANIPDDWFLQKSGVLAPNITNSTYTVTFPITIASTNGWSLAVAQDSATNHLGCRYAKLIGITAAGCTNGLSICSLRAHYWTTTSQY
jgi:hypothetical protein